MKPGLNQPKTYQEGFNFEEGFANQGFSLRWVISCELAKKPASLSLQKCTQKYLKCRKFWFCWFHSKDWKFCLELDISSEAVEEIEKFRSSIDFTENAKKIEVRNTGFYQNAKNLKMSRWNLNPCLDLRNNHNLPLHQGDIHVCKSKYFQIDEWVVSGKEKTPVVNWKFYLFQRNFAKKHWSWNCYSGGFTVDSIHFLLVCVKK